MTFVFIYRISEAWSSEHHLQNHHARYGSIIIPYLIFESKLLESMFSAHPKKQVHSLKRSRDLVRWCRFDLLTDTECRQQFYHTLTAHGICSSFNAYPIEMVRAF